MIARHGTLYRELPMFGIGWGELAVIFVLILILFGPNRAQGIFRAFGRGLKEFKDAMSSLNTDNTSPKPADFQQKEENGKDRRETPMGPDTKKGRETDEEQAKDD